MTITTRPATRTDVLEVIADLSPQSAADIKQMQFSSADEAMGFYALRVPEQDAVTFVENDKPIAVAGWDKEHPAWYSWLVAANGFYRPDPKPVFASRRYLRRLRKAHPNVQFLTIASTDTLAMHRWLTCLGFTRIQQRPLNVWMFAG